jgi:hypothetical protein
MFGTRLGRRLVTIPLFVGLTTVFTALLPLLLLIALLLTALPSMRGSLPTLGFVLGYLWCETIGIVCSLVIWLRHREREAFLTANFKLQCWWANALKVIGERLFRLTFHISGEECVEKGAAYRPLSRHCGASTTELLRRPRGSG